MELEKLEEWFGEKLPELLEDSSEYPIFLVATRNKPGALTMNVTEEQARELQEMCRELDLSIRVAKGRVSKPGVAVGERPEHDQRCAFIARDDERFKVLEESEGRFYGFSDRAVGEFLGFPESAIKFFEQNEQPGMESKKRILEEKPEERELLALTTFIPSPDALEEAIEIGRKRKMQLEEFDSENGSHLGEQFIEKRMKDSLY